MKKIFFAMMMFVSFQIFAERILSDCAYLRSAEASSTLSEWLSGKEVVYDALNAFDNDTETVWVENADDSGIDERLTVVFYEPIKIDEIQIINGFAHKDYYKKNNRVKSLNIGFLYTDAGYVRSVDNYKKLTADYEHLWQWKENPNININDYSFIVDIGYRYMDHREFSFDSSTNSVITEQGTVHNGPDGFGGGYEYRDYLVDVDPNSTYEPFSSVSEPNYRIDVNGNQYLLVDPECLFVDFWEP